MKRIAGISWALLAVPLLLTQSAQADFIQVMVDQTIVGTVTGGVDTYGLFGQAGANLTGDTIAVELTYYYYPNGYYNSQFNTYFNYGLIYEPWYGGFQDSYGFMHETVTIGSNSMTFYGDADAGGDAIPNVNSNGTPRSSFLSTYIGGPCYGQFSTIASLNGEQACESGLSTRFLLGTTSASILSVAGANTLFSSVTAGSIGIDPYIVPNPTYNEPSSEGFSFTTDPEPATSLLAATALALTALILSGKAQGNHLLPSLASWRPWANQSLPRE
jgi:hypothetical protein